MTELFGSPNVNFNVNQLFIPGEFTSFHRVLIEMVYGNLLPSKHFAKIGLLNVKILYYIGKWIAFDVG